MSCPHCDGPIRGHQCAKCKRWTWEEHVTIRRETVLWEHVADKPLERMSLGILDECLCGGVVKSDVVMIAGEPGAGKSTLLLKTCEFIYRHGPCLYIGAEEDIPTIVARGRRLGMNPPPGRMIFLNAMGGGTDIGAELMRVRPVGFIVDSSNSLVGNDLNLEIKALEIIKKFCVQLQAPAIVISQVNASLDFSGLMAKRHNVDVLLRLSKVEEKRSENGEPYRVLESIDKNRNGRVGIETYLEMTEEGLVEAGSKCLTSDSEVSDVRQ